MSDIAKALNVTEELESLIDQTSLLHVLTGLELVCSEKAALMQHAWGAAKVWNEAGSLIGKLVWQIESLNI